MNQPEKIFPITSKQTNYAVRMPLTTFSSIRCSLRKCHYCTPTVNIVRTLNDTSVQNVVCTKQSHRTEATLQR